MKCRKCGFINPDYVDSCRKCQSDLTGTKTLLGNSSFKPERVCFLSRLLQPVPAPGEEKDLLPTAGLAPLREEISDLPRSEQIEGPADFDFSQFDVSDLVEENPSEMEFSDPAGKPRSPSTEAPDLDFPELDLTTLDISTPVLEESERVQAEQEIPSGDHKLDFDLDDGTALEALLGGSGAYEGTTIGENSTGMSEPKMEDKDIDDMPPPPAVPSQTTGKRRDRKKTKAVSLDKNFSGVNLYYERAGLWPRFGAFCFDWCLIYLIMLFFLVGVIASGKIALESMDGLYGASALDMVLVFILPLHLTFFSIMGAYFIFFHGYVGQTPGKMLFGLKVVHTSGLPVSFGHAFLRWIGFLLGAMPLNAGLLWVVVDKKRQGWHDKITDTYVVRTL